jgi:hypothetical protein
MFEAGFKVVHPLKQLTVCIQRINKKKIGEFSVLA